MGARFLSILLLPHFGTQSSHLCASLAGCGNPLVLDLLNLGPVLLYLLTGLDIFLFLWVITVISLLILMMLPGKNTFPQPVETPMGWLLNHRLQRQGGALEATRLSKFPNFVAAPDLSDEKPPLEQKWLLNTKSTKLIKIKRVSCKQLPTLNI